MRFLWILILLFCSKTSFNQNVSSQDNYNVNLYWIKLEVSNLSTYIEGSAIIKLSSESEQLDSILLNFGKQLSVDSVLVDSQLSAWRHSDDSLWVIYPEIKYHGEQVYVEVYYSGDADDTEHKGAAYNRTNEYGSYTYTLTEPYSTKYWYPCKEVLDDKADSVFVDIVVDSNLLVGSNGLLDSVMSLDNGKCRFSWRSYYPTAFYLVSFAVGDYSEYSFVTKLNDSLEFPVINYVYKGDYLSEHKPEIDYTDTLLKLLSTKLGTYPFADEKYGHCLAPLGGGMEHQTMTTLGSFDFGLVAHELAHQWFGNYVTCRYWNDIWINEGFASFLEYYCIEQILGKDVAAPWMTRAHELALEEPDGAIYVSDDELADEKRVFSGQLTYKKGAAVLQMLRHEIANDSLFFKILSTFLTTHKFGLATGNDFKSIVEELSNKSFDKFFTQWYYGKGYPLIDFYWWQTDGVLNIVANHEGSSKDNSVFHLKMDYRLFFTNHDTIITQYIQSVSDTLKLPLKQKVWNVKVDPGQNILMRVGQLRNLNANEAIPEIVVYPNPAVSSLNIFSPKHNGMYTASIIDENGRVLLLVEQINISNDIIDITSLWPGSYILNLQNKYNNFNIRFIKH